jgi:DNA polymerase-3 subunit beta
MYAIKTDAFKSILLFTAKADVRYYLKGINVQINTGIVRLTASDGHTLATYTETAVDNDNYILTIPRESVEIALKANGKRATIDLDPRCTLAGVPFTPIDGNYPNVKRVWEQERTIAGTPMLINPEYYSRIGKVAKLEGVGYSGIKLWHMNDGLFFEAGDIRGLIMGMRECDVNKGDKPGF